MAYKFNPFTGTFDYYESSTPGGSNTQVQYNSSSAFAGSSAFTWDNTNSSLALGLAGTLSGTVALQGLTSGSTTLKGADIGGSGVVTFFASGSITTTFLDEINSLVGVVGNNRSTGQSGANALATYTVGSSDSSFLVSANVNVTTSTTHNFTVTCTYTDEGNTSRTLTFGFTQLSGATLLTAITNITGAGPYESPTFHIRCKAGTTIVIASTGTFTSVTYNIEERITRLG